MRPVTKYSYGQEFPVGHESIEAILNQYVMATEVSQQQAVEAIECFSAPEGAPFTNPALSSVELIEKHLIQEGNNLTSLDLRNLKKLN